MEVPHPYKTQGRGTSLQSLKLGLLLWHNYQMHSLFPPEYLGLGNKNMIIYGHPKVLKEL